jgi:hypothetical protein
LLPLFEEVPLVDVELRRLVSRIGFARGRLERTKVRTVDLVALYQADVAQACRGLDRIDDVDQHREVRRDQFGPRRPILVSGVEDMGDVGEIAQRPPGVRGVEQVNGQVPDGAVAWPPGRESPTTSQSPSELRCSMRLLPMTPLAPATRATLCSRLMAPILRRSQR